MKRLLLIALTLLLAGAQSLRAQENTDGPQLYNMSFDHWSKDGSEWLPYPQNATRAQKVWGTANHGLKILGLNGAYPEEKHVARSGKGKKAACLKSQSVFFTFASGALFNGRFVKVLGTSGAEITWGVPFNGRPVALCGFQHYQPKPIDNYSKAYKRLKGQLDNGSIEVYLTDWTAERHINTNEGNYIDPKTDPHVIGYGKLILDKAGSDYSPFRLEIGYKDDRTPTMVVISASPSLYGGYFTGGDGSLLYLDELYFTY